MADVREAANKVIEEGVAEFGRIITSGGWEDIGETEDVRRYKKQEGDRIFVKALGVINFAPSDVADFIINQSNRPKFIADLDSSKVLHDFPDLKIVHEVMKLPWPVSNRDSVFAMKRINQGEDVLVLSRSVNVGHPEVPDVVRADMIVIAYHLKNIEDIATEITFVGCVDPRGNIPVLVINQLAGTQCLAVSRIRNAINQG